MTDTDNSVKGTILVVDDDAPTRRALRVTLSEMNFNVIEAARGEEALSLVRITWFDAVLLAWGEWKRAGEFARQLHAYRF